MHFGRSIDDLGEIFNVNFPDDWLQKSRREQDPEQNEGFLRASLGRVAVGAMTLAEVYNLSKALSRDELAENLLAAPSDVGIVHMWSQQSKISPDAANQAIADQMQQAGRQNYESVRLDNPRSQHGPTVAFALQGAALERAIELPSRDR